MAESLSKKPRVTGPLTALNLLNGAFVPPVEEKYIDVISPSTGQVIGKCALSSDTDVQQAVAKGQEAFAQWQRTTVKARAAIMFKFHTLLKQYQGNWVETRCIF